MIAQKPTNTVEPPAPAKLVDNFVPPPILEIERKGSGRKQSIKSMSNLIHDEIQSSKNSVRQPSVDVNSNYTDYSLAKREKISRETIARMSAFKRHQKNAEVSPEFKSTPWKDKGYVAWLGWGGTSGINWAAKKLQQIDKKL